MGESQWERVEAHLLSGKIIDIIGFGRIGRKIAEFLKPFGVKLLFYNPFIELEYKLDPTIILMVKTHYLINQILSLFMLQVLMVVNWLFSHMTM